MNAQARSHPISQPFTPLTDAEFFYFTRLGREDLLAAYIELKRHCWAGKNTCWPSAERQAQETGRKVATVRRRLEDLEQLGVIRVVRAAEAKRRGNRYILTQQNEWKGASDLQHKNNRLPAQGADPDRGRAVEGDRPRSAKQIDPREVDPGKTYSEARIARTVTTPVRHPKAERQVAVVSEQLRLQLQQVGVQLTPSFMITLTRSATEDVERALSCLKAAKHVDNHTGYFLAALKGNWTPPASLSAVREKRDKERAERGKQLRLEIEQVSHRLELLFTDVDAGQEAEDWLAAEEEMRRMLNKPIRTEVELLLRREEVKAERRHYRQAEEAQQRRRLELLKWELERLTDN